MRNFFSFLTLLFVMLWSYPIRAACTVSSGTDNLGTQSSFTVYNSALRAQGTGGLTCSGLGLSLLGANTLTITIVSTTNSMYMTNTDGSGDKIPYLIYPDSNYQYPHTVGQSIDYASLNLLSIIFGSANVNVPIYIQTIRGANVRAGTYTDTIKLSWTYHICGIGIGGLCLSWDGKDVPGTISLTLQVTKDCLITSTPDVNFGTMALVGQFSAVNQNISLACTKTEGYNTYFTNGNNATTGWRQMKSTLNNLLQYQIYLPDSTTVWDSTNKQAGSGTGLEQKIPYKAAINSAQGEKPAGSYQDNVSFVVEY